MQPSEHKTVFENIIKSTTQTFECSVCVSVILLYLQIFNNI